MKPKTRKKRPTKKASGYHREPEIPEELRERFALVLATITGDLSVSEAARQAGLSRQRFLSLKHRAMASMIQSLEPKEAGRPAQPERERELEKRVEKLGRENEKLQHQVENTHHLLAVASDLFYGRPPMTTIERLKRSKRKKKPSKPEGGDDDDCGIRGRLEAAITMREQGVPPVLAAGVIGASAPTVRRWRARDRKGEPLCQRTRPKASLPPPHVYQQVADIIRALGGLVGEEALRHSVPGVSRRQARRIKRQVLTEMEQERRAKCTRVVVTQPDVMRGFDAMCPRRDRNGRYILAAGDSAIPYRTLLAPCDRYTSGAVMAFLERDLALNGAPLVYRMDRAGAHRTADVAALLRAHDVLMLHGPPRHPQYYGALERQNREHSAWLRAQRPDDDELEGACVDMKHALNCVWRRRTLRWQTAEEEWRKRPPVRIDRAEFRDQVGENAARLRAEAHFEDAPEDVVMRFAIEIELMRRRLLSLQPGGWC